MPKSVKNLFQNLKNLDPSRGIEDRILKAIALEKNRLAKRKLAFVYTGFFVSFGAFFYAALSSGSAFLRSDFWNIARLIFTDARIVTGHWQDFSLSLLETFPVTDLIVLLAPVFAVLLLLNLYFKLINNNQHNYIS